ncbi:hypothetical protein HanPSC8_Chr08g0344681 [Helianthus annuus]|nr:hypothetical protein HanPSC8_Chr08g0344681 [Helianthus annuus]
MRQLIIIQTQESDSEGSNCDPFVSFVTSLIVISVPSFSNFHLVTIFPVSISNWFTPLECGFPSFSGHISNILVSPLVNRAFCGFRFEPEGPEPPLSNLT